MLTQRVQRGASRALLVSAAVCLQPGVAAGQDPSTSPLAFLEPLIGTWTSDPGWLVENPGLDALVPISFRWGPTPYSVVDHAAVPVRGQLATVSFIVWNPVSRRAEFMATQSNDSLLFKGHYEPLANGNVRRTYDVHYPDGSLIRFRETFFFDGPDSFDWLTEWQRDGRWEPRRGDGNPEYRALRREAAVDRELTALERWVGRWVAADGSTVSIDPADPSRGFRLRSRGADQGTQEGLLLYDPHVTGFRGAEVDETGSVERSAWSFEGDAIVRVVERFEASGHVRRWVERWTLDGSGDCFQRSTEDVQPRISEASYCRTSGKREALQ